jgi:alkanesulfonate monooxygenase SsuD/methylene tetrahydromethanopterin reductase-like flavin-dependent oxidoreductase (luciferase family)/predicted kinase
MDVSAGLPDPALVVLVGPSGAGKSTWAETRYRTAEVVSSDALRGVVGSGRHDLDASVDAFGVLDLVVGARLRRGLTTVVDTLGLDTERRLALLAAARERGLPAVVVAFDTAPALCRERNRGRDRPVPAPVLTQQLRAFAGLLPTLVDEGWDHVEVVTTSADHPAAEAPASTDASADRSGPRVVLQVSRFPWGEDPAGWLREVALAADEVGLAGVALMDHLIQIPQVGTAWEPIPEPWVTLGLLAGLDTRLELGTLVTPVTLREPGITAKAVATLDVLTGGRAFVGVGAGWWAREHAAYSLPFPPPVARIAALERGIETMRALWAPGTKAYDGERVSLPETTCYPRPVRDVPVVVGGAGRLTLRVAARLGDACNVSSREEVLGPAVATLHEHCEDLGRDPADVAVTVLDLPVVGTDREDAWERVERLRGRTSAAAYARGHHAGTAAQHRARYEALHERGVSTVFVALPDLAGPEDVHRLAGVVSRLA